MTMPAPVRYARRCQLERRADRVAFTLTDRNGAALASITLDAVDVRVLAADLERIAPLLSASPVPAGEGHPRPPGPQENALRPCRGRPHS